MIENDPSHIGRDAGLLTQLAALKRIAARDEEVAVVIVLLDVSAMALDLAMVIATSISYTPTTYSALLVRDIFLRVVRIVDGMTKELNPSDIPPSVTPATRIYHADNDNEPLEATLVGKNPFNDVDPPPQPPKRRRGRPRKSQLN